MNLEDIINSNEIKEIFEFENKKFIAFENFGFLINNQRILSKYHIDLKFLKKANNNCVMLNDSLFLDVNTNEIYNYFQLPALNPSLNKNVFYFYKEINSFVKSDVDLSFCNLPQKIKNEDEKENIFLIYNIAINKNYNCCKKTYIYKNKFYLSSGDFINNEKEMERQHKAILLDLNI